MAHDLYFAPGMVDKRNTAVMAAGAPSSDGYSFYNPFDEPVTLRIPPIPPALSEQRGGLGKTAKKYANMPVGIRLASTTDKGVHLNPSICALAHGDIGEKEFPQRPSLAPYGIAIRSDNGPELSAHAIRKAKSGGRVFPAVFYNRGKTPVTFEANVASLSGSANSEYSVLSSNNGHTDELGDQFSVTVSPGQQETRWIAVGTTEYRRKVVTELSQHQFAFTKLGPNPFRNELSIRYTVPIEGMNSVTVEIRDMAGRLVRKITGERGTPGANRIVWDGRSSTGGIVGTGAYVVRLIGESRTGGESVVKSHRIVRIAK
jgi:hypothetical protein